MSYSHYQAPSNYSQPHFWRPDPQLFPRPPTPCITPQHPSNRQPPIPPNVHGGQGSSHLDKVWEACIASQPKVEYDWDQRPTTQQTSHTSFSQPHQQRSTNQPLSRSLFSQPHLQPLANRQPVHPHFSQPQQALSLPAAELQDRVSRWSRLIPYPSIPVPEQQIVFRRLPVRSWRRSVPAPAWQPVPEPNPLHHNEALESPVVLLQAPKKRGRARGKRSKQPILRSSQMLNQVTRPYPAAVVDNIVQADAPFVNTNGRNHELSSPLFPTPPEIKMETPSDDPMSIIVKMPGMRVPGSTDWIDDSLPVPYGNDRSNPLRTPPPKPPVGEKTPFNDKNMVSAAKALWTMFQAPTTDYSSPSQAMLAITLISAIPPHLDPRAMISTTEDPIRVIDNLVERFASGIHRAAMDARAKGIPFPVGAVQMLWELNFVCLQRWGGDSLLAWHTEGLATALGEQH